MQAKIKKGVVIPIVCDYSNKIII